MHVLKSFLMAALAAASLSGAAAAASTYAVAGSIPIPDGGWDYASFDPTSRQVFIARSTSITAVDVSTGDAARSFGTIARGHAALPLPEGKLAVTSGSDNTLRLFEQRGGTQLASVPVGADPDAAIFDPHTRNVIVMDAREGSVAVVDPVSAKLVRKIALKPGLEFAAVDRRGTLFVNNEDLSRIDVVNPATGSVAAPIALTGCEGPSGLAYDAKTDRLIAACANGKAAVVDAGRKRLVGLLDIGKGPDAVLLDAGRRLAFIPCGRDGTLVQIALDGAQGPKVAATIKTEMGARTGAIDPSDGTIYLPAARFGPPPAAGGRPAMIPGSAHLVLVKPSAGG